MCVYSISTGACEPDCPSAALILPAIFKAVTGDFEVPFTDSEQFCRYTSLEIADNTASSGPELKLEISRPRWILRKSSVVFVNSTKFDAEPSSGGSRTMSGALRESDGSLGSMTTRPLSATLTG